jgi:hypothetical protein
MKFETSCAHARPHRRAASGRTRQCIRRCGPRMCTHWWLTRASESVTSYTRKCAQLRPHRRRRTGVRVQASLNRGVGRPCPLHAAPTVAAAPSLSRRCACVGVPKPWRPHRLSSLGADSPLKALAAPTLLSRCWLSPLCAVSPLYVLLTLLSIC